MKTLIIPLLLCIIFCGLACGNDESDADMDVEDEEREMEIVHLAKEERQMMMYMALMEGKVKLANDLWEMEEERPRKIPSCIMGNLLHFCFMRDDPELVNFARKILVELSNEEVNEKDFSNDTPLLTALKKSGAEAAMLMIKAGCDVHARAEDDKTALHLASGREGFTHLVNIFVKAGVELEAKDSRKETAVQVAFKKGPIETVQLLMKAGADVRGKSPEGHTMLHLAAVRKGFEQVTEMLLDKGVNTEERIDNGNTCLHEALKRGSVEMVQLLLLRGVDFTAVGGLGRNSLHLAARRNDTAGVVQNLIEKGLEIDAKDAEGNSALHHALKGRHDKVALKLLDMGADYYASTQNGEFPLAMACAWEKMLDVAKMILEKGFDPNTRNMDGITAMHVAADHCCVKIIKLLLSFGADVNAMNLKRASPLQSASLSYCSSNRRETIRLLIDHGARIGNTNQNLPFFTNLILLLPLNAEMILQEYPETEFYDGLLNTIINGHFYSMSDAKRINNAVDARLLAFIINNGANITRGMETLWLFAHKIYKQEEVSNRTFLEFLQFAIKIQIGFGNSKHILESYSDREILALYRISKRVYEEMVSDEEDEKAFRAYNAILNERQLHYYDEIIMEMTKGTYVYKLPHDLASDIIQNVHCSFSREISRFSWILSLVEATTTEKITDENGHFIKPKLIMRHFVNITL